MDKQRRVPPSHGFRPGRLVIVGSGIKSISQFTLEAVAHIEQADKVFYCVADPLTDIFIEKHNPNAVDLYKYYNDGKPRHQTYTQMAEVMLREVRKGFFVVGVFYGHPGVFVNPSHRALAIANSEGFEAVMLPGVSAEDCLFADLHPMGRIIRWSTMLPRNSLPPSLCGNITKSKTSSALILPSESQAFQLSTLHPKFCVLRRPPQRNRSG